MKKILAIICTLISFHVFGQWELEDGMPSEPGKCYAKCLIQNVYEDSYEYFYRYTGEDTENTDGVFRASIITSPSSTRWEKKKDKNCHNLNPERCFFWCLVEEPAEYVSFYAVEDTFLVDEYVLDSLLVTSSVREGGFTEWREVVCDTDITKEFYERLQIALIEKGYDISDKKGALGSTSKAALVQYQRVNGLPVGNLNIETLHSLDIDY